MQLTREQQLTLVDDRPVVVEANAGSGKTRVLVERYFALLRRYGTAVIRSVVAITFTRAAAAEMFTRIAKKLEQLLADPAYQAEWKQLKKLRERLSSARISTIHSFAAQLLRDYAVEANVPPTFTELTEYDAWRLKQEQLEELVAEVLQNPDDPHHDLIWQLLLRYGRAPVIDLFEYLLKSSEQFWQWYELLVVPVEQLMALRDQALIRQLNSLFAEYRYWMEELLKIVQWNDTPTARQHKAQFEQWWQRRLTLTAVDDVVPFLDTWIEHHLLLFQKSGEPRKRVLQASIPRYLVSIIGKIFKQAVKLWQSLAEEAFDATMFRSLQEILKFIQRVFERVDAEKRYRGVLDFDDLQLWLLQLFQQHPAVVEELRRQIRFLMIDEFQDTNVVQYELIRRLSVLDDPQTGANLFVVGDPKQGIYGFRGADVRVFMELRQTIEQFNRKRYGNTVPQTVPVATGSVEIQNAAEWWGNITLTASFRMVPRLAAFINEVCGNLMQQQFSPYEIAYTPLVVARSDEQQGSITFLTAIQSEEAEQEGTESVSEAELVARFVHNAVEGPSPLHCGVFQGIQQPESQRPLRYADIAILMRSRTRIDALTTALRKYGVPFVVHAGIGFYQQPEIQDIRAFLLFLHNPHDDIALATILRSPFFACDDDSLFALSKVEGNSLWEKLQSAVSTKQPWISSALQFAYDQLVTLLPLAARLSLPTLIRLILERCYWKAKIAADPRRDQMIANMEKLIQQARDYQQRGLVNLYDFAQQLLERARVEQREGEAELLAGKDAVQIMTIHAAKGQEFPCVVLYDLNRRERSTEQSLFVSHSMFGGAIPWIGKQSEQKPQQTPAVVLAQLENEGRERAELKRLLYVALTRAQDHLVLSSSVTVNKSGQPQRPQGLLALLLEGLRKDADFLLQSQQVYLSTPIGCLNSDGYPASRTIAVPIALRSHVEWKQSASQQRKNVLAPPRIVLPKVVRWSSRGNFVSASQLTTLAHDAAYFEHRYLLGLPADVGYSVPLLLPKPDQEEDSEYGSIRGELFHYAMEHLRHWYSSKGIEQEQLQQLLQSGLRRFERYVPQKIVEELLKIIHRLMQTDLIQQYRESLLQAEMEKELWIPFGEDILFGRMDCVIYDADGNVEVWDWKVTTEPLDRAYQRYRPQLLVYLYLVAHWKREQERYRGRLLFVDRVTDRGDLQWVRTIEVTAAELNDPTFPVREWYQWYRKYCEV